MQWNNWLSLPHILGFQNILASHFFAIGIIDFVDSNFFCLSNIHYMTCASDPWLYYYYFFYVALIFIHHNSPLKLVICSWYFTDSSQTVLIWNISTCWSVTSHRFHTKQQINYITVVTHEATLDNMIIKQTTCNVTGLVLLLFENENIENEAVACPLQHKDTTKIFHKQSTEMVHLVHYKNIHVLLLVVTIVAQWNYVYCIRGSGSLL